MQIYVDGALVYQNALSRVDTYLNVSPGSHLVALKAWDSAGASYIADCGHQRAIKPQSQRRWGVFPGALVSRPTARLYMTCLPLGPYTLVNEDCSWSD